MTVEAGHKSTKRFVCILCDNTVFYRCYCYFKMPNKSCNQNTIVRNESPPQISLYCAISMSPFQWLSASTEVNNVTWLRAIFSTFLKGHHSMHSWSIALQLKSLPGFYCIQRFTLLRSCTEATYTKTEMPFMATGSDVLYPWKYMLIFFTLWKYKHLWIPVLCHQYIYILHTYLYNKIVLMIINCNNYNKSNRRLNLQNPKFNDTQLT